MLPYGVRQNPHGMPLRLPNSRRKQQRSCPTSNVPFWRPGVSWQAYRKHLGLTLVEALIAMMILGILVGIVLNLIVSTAFMANRSEQYNQAMNWIQADVEQVRSDAREYEKNAFPYSPKCTQPANLGLAASFANDKLGGIDTVQLGPKEFGGRYLVLDRVARYHTSADPSRIVRLNYTARPREGGEVIARFEMEVVPHAALKCP